MPPSDTQVAVQAPPSSPAPEGAPGKGGRGSRRANRREKLYSDTASGALYPRWYWPSFAAPGTLYLILFFLIPFYVIFGMAFGYRDQITRLPIPEWQPWYWTGEAISTVFHEVAAYELPVFIRTFAYVFIASFGCVTIGYTIAYYVARFGGKRKGAYLAALVAPFFISFLMRILAWINLLGPQGYATKLFNAYIPFTHIHMFPFMAGVDWLGGKHVTVILGLIYGYVPYMVLPLFGFLDSISPSLLEAGRDLGASATRTFMRVTLPISKAAILAGLVIVSLPMFGDYYTPHLLSGQGNTLMIGNLVDNAVNAKGQSRQAGVYVLILMIILLVPLAYYLVTTKRQLERR